LLLAPKDGYNANSINEELCALIPDEEGFSLRRRHDSCLRSHAVVFVAATGIQALQAAAQGRRRRATRGGAAAASGARGKVSRDAGRGARASRRGLAPGDGGRVVRESGDGDGSRSWASLIFFFSILGMALRPCAQMSVGSAHGVPHSFWS
jgi:hypothetical protein